MAERYWCIRFSDDSLGAPTTLERAEAAFLRIDEDRRPLCRIVCLEVVEDERDTLVPERDPFSHAAIAEGLPRTQQVTLDEAALSSGTATEEERDRKEVIALRSLIHRISPRAMHAHDSGAGLPRAGWYEDTEGGNRTHVFEVCSESVGRELDDARAELATKDEKIRHLYELLDQAAGDAVR